MPSDKALVAAAHAALPTTNGVHSVAAAALDDAGHIHTGVNLFHFSGGPCAEMVALANAVGCRPVRIVAVGDEGRGVLPPCGRCRQIMLDLYPGIVVVMPDGAVAVEELLPGAYRWRDR